MEKSPVAHKQEGLLGSYQHASNVLKFLREGRVQEESRVRKELIALMKTCDAVMVRRPLEVEGDVVIEDVRLFNLEIAVETVSTIQSNHMKSRLIDTRPNQAHQNLRRSRTTGAAHLVKKDLTEGFSRFSWSWMRRLDIFLTKVKE